ncbi:inorganic diphosphatase [Geochorda subterranea]|uniref:Inorganic pyrophosphatase n=1 Tax=Geochorda subterranea TaxID=3109564 RepID=A0ABZ1BN70_9FIRM|nr:inorganic diphosphatase [Limnochorda sp. LNt]WRP14247.1 inorganic diphosphatase [Limnochorda sp. LNt]
MAGLPESVLVVIEVPKGTQNKYEYDPATGRMVLNRVLYSPMYYPGEYGFVPDTLAEDGDPLDVLVISSIATFPGCAVPVRVLGALDMEDDKGPDTKVLGVVSVDPRLEEMDTLADVPHHFLREVEHFFKVYKELEGKPCIIRGWHDARHAWRLIVEARRRFLSGARDISSPSSVACGERPR